MRGPWQLLRGVGGPAGGRQRLQGPHTVGSGGVPGGERAVQAKLRGAHVQGCRRARLGPPEGRGTRGWQGALPGGRGRGRARG